MEIRVGDDRRIVEVWLSRAEQEDARLYERLKPICREYSGRKYTVAVFRSGGGDLYEQTHQLLLNERRRGAECPERSARVR